MTDSQTLHAITVLGRDRPGIIADAAARLAELGLNLQDSTMTLLGGHFSMMLLSAGSAPTETIEAALEPLTADGTLAVSVRVVAADERGSATGAPWILSVHGGDRPGIVSALVGEVARVGGNITDLTTRLAGALYVVIAEIDVPGGVDHDALQRSITSVARDLGVEASLRPAEADDL